MTAAPDRSPRDERSAAKRRQLLEAATECFRVHGFHNARMSQICKAARMSVGQVYHYFENKEAIIAACVEHQMEAVFAMIEGFELASNPAEALLRGPDPEDAPVVDPALMLEVYAEAGRNPVVAERMRRIDARLRERFTRMLARADAARGLPDAPNRELRAEAMIAIPLGIQVRLVANPDASFEQFVPTIRLAYRAILDG